MNLTSILGLLSLAGWALLLAGAGLAITNMAQNRPARGGILLAIMGLIVGVVFFIASSGLVQVGATQVAVVFQAIGGNPDNNNLWARPLGPGVHIIVPIVNEPFIYSTEVRNYTMSKSTRDGNLSGDDSVQARTRDGQQVDIDISVLYSIDPALANIVHIRFQNRFEADFVRPTIRSAVRERIAAYTVNELYGGAGVAGAETISKLPQVQDDLRDEMRLIFAENGLLLQDFLVREVTFSEEFIRAVESKQVAEQQAEQAKQEAERARTIAKGESDANVTRAKGQAEAAIEEARGEAEAIKLRAAAESEALALIGAQIIKNPQLIQWRYVENLSDQVELILLPSNSPFLFDLESLRNATTQPNN